MIETEYIEDEELESADLPEPAVKVGKKLNRWGAFGFVFLAALITVFYVYTVIRTDTLLQEIQDLKKKQKEQINKNRILTGIINKNESPERIIRLATQRLGMVRASAAPEYITK